MITHLKFAGVACRDQDLQPKFWTEKMGFRVTTDQPMGAQRWIELALATARRGWSSSRPRAMRTASAPSSTGPSLAMMSSRPTAN